MAVLMFVKTAHEHQYCVRTLNSERVHVERRTWEIVTSEQFRVVHQADQ